MIVRIFSAGILKIVYGMEITSSYDQYIHKAKLAGEGASVATLPGAFWIEFAPWLKFIPEWVPGATFKKVANYYKPFVEQVRNEPFELVQSAAVRYLVLLSFTL